MRAQITPMRLLGRLADGREESKPSAMSGDLVIESEFVDELGATVTVARLRTDSSVSASELLQALVNVKVTELSDEAFAPTGVEVRGASKFVQVCTAKLAR